MALFLLPLLVSSRSLRNVVREVRSLPTDDRTKKQIINEWFELQSTRSLFDSTRTDTELTRRLRQNLVSDPLAVGLLDVIRDRTGLAGRVNEVRTILKYRVFNEVFGAQRLGRLSG